MTWHVDPPVRIGPDVLAAIVEARVTVHTTDHAISGYADKHPVLYLFQRGDVVSGFDTRGRHLTRDEIERRFPDALERLDALLDEEH